MAIKKNTNILSRTKNQELDTKDNKTLQSVANEKKEIIKKSQGRPKKFKDEIAAKIMMGFTANQLALIDERAKQLGITVRLDYIRKLIADDIGGFND